MAGSEIVKFSNQFNSIALRRFDAVHLDVLMAIAARVREKGSKQVTFSFVELRHLMNLGYKMSNRDLSKKIVDTNRRLLALNYEFTDSGKVIQFALFTRFVTDLSTETLEVRVNEDFAFLLNDLTSSFTRFELAEFTGLRSRYAKEFYRRAKQYRSTGLWTVSREDFCRLLDVPAATAGAVRDLNKRVLRPIMEECGPLMRLQVERKYEGRRLTGFVFMFQAEQPPAPPAPPAPSRPAAADKARKAAPASGGPARRYDAARYATEVAGRLDAAPADYPAFKRHCLAQWRSGVDPARAARLWVAAHPVRPASPPPLPPRPDATDQGALF